MLPTQTKSAFYRRVMDLQTARGAPRGNTVPPLPLGQFAWDGFPDKCPQLRGIPPPAPTETSPVCTAHAWPIRTLLSMRWAQSPNQGPCPSSPAPQKPASIPQSLSLQTRGSWSFPQRHSCALGGRMGCWGALSSRVQALCLIA